MSARPRLLLWPETALPILPDTAMEALYGRLQAWVDARHVALLTGAITPAGAGAGGRTRYRNSALLFRPGRGRPDAYHKVHLVPFAERVPFVERWPWLEALTVPAGGVTGYVPGPRAAPLPFGDTSLGVMICLESLFGNQARALVEQGAGVLVTLTQDGWWGPTPGFRQHLSFNRLRAVETGRALVQVSVTGLSALLLPDGSTVALTGWMARSATLVHVPLYTGTTFFVRHGDWVIWTALAFSVLLLGACFVYPPSRRRRRPKPTPADLTP